MSATRGNFFRNDLFDPDPFGDQEPAQPDPAPRSSPTTYQERPEVIHYQAVPHTRVVEPTRLIAASPAPGPVDEEFLAPAPQKRLSKTELRQQAVSLVKGNSDSVLTGAGRWKEAASLAWNDVGSSKAARVFTQKIVRSKWTILLLGDDVSILATGGLTAPVGLGTDLLFGAGLLIYLRKVRKYHGMLDE